MSGSISPPMGVPGGGIPRPPGAPSNVGPVTVPQQNGGNIMQAAQKLAAAHKMILEALPALPLGTPLHEAVMKVATDLGKQLAKAGEDAKMTVQTLMQAMRGHRNDQQMQTVSHMAGQAPPNAPPAMQGATPPPPSPSMAG